MAYIILATWWTLPLYVALLYLGVTRQRLETNNLYDTYLPKEWTDMNTTCDGVNVAARTLSGVCNSLEVPAMGSVGTRFSRFVPINKTFGETTTLFTPNPRTISQHLFKRQSFTPATSINLLAAAWIQFQTHDWFSHGAENDPNNLLVFQLPRDDPLRTQGQTNMTLRRTIRQVHQDGRPDTYNNHVSSWWDLSMVYGEDEETHAKLRSFTNGKMKVEDDNLIPVDPVSGLDLTGFNDNWWAGLSLLTNIWVREHNLVCDMLKNNNPNWSDQEIFDHARLITTALNAKIHTVEWTPALLANDILKNAMNANWFGLAPEWLKAIPDPNLSQQISEAWYGIIGGKPNFAGVNFAHSEEFVSVYRFHSLLRDNITIRRHTDGSSTGNTYNISQYAFRNAQNVIRGNDFADVAYTFGVDNPGALILNNYPAEMMSLNKPGAPYTLDMGAVDVLRDRERGVPRYNEFRRLFSLIPAKTMDDISDDKAAVAALRSVYGENVESVDLLAGSLAESPRATGFAFSNTQFQAFILAASRRLLTDRFFTTDYTAAVASRPYTQQGLDYIGKSDFRAVIGRTIPALNQTVHSVDNAFKPWVV
ncbi:hypothetical protein MIND_01293600 [Mycena indigotica]|uniref:Peroxidase n=1 Tax=Mycena indigotica TaxID=2126181 RepID=A0A8H6VQQ3_9AGAR|nr:uncharacterized protein MIND_01293600 [Mycena indigotica]KAF7290537.1 hypothetical protein MIND_01293600 [Mycena indigotica]